MAALASMWAAIAHAETLSVGTGKAYAAPCAAVAAAHDNDVIEIDAAGDYSGDVCRISKNGLTLRGVGGRAKIDAQGKNAGGKAIWVISGHDTTVEDHRAPLLLPRQRRWHPEQRAPSQILIE